MNEILRRMVLLTGTLAATVLFSWSSGRLVRVAVEADIDSARQDMVQQKSGAEWDWVFQRVTSADRSIGDEFFHPTEPPFPEFLQELAETRYAYGMVQIQTETGQGLLSVDPLNANWAARTAPISVAFPHRWLSPWVLGLALVLYCAIPWPRRMGGNVLQYGWLTSGLVPDLFVALPLVLLFFAMPFQIVGLFSETGSPLDLLNFSEGWAFLTIVMWGLAALGASIFWFTAWYTAYAFEVRAEGVWIRTMRGEREYCFDEIVDVKASRVGLTEGARRWLWLAAIINWRVLPAVILSETADMRAIDLVLADGGTVRLPVGGLSGVESLLDSLKSKAHGKSSPFVHRIPKLAEIRPPWIAAGWIELLRRAILLGAVAIGGWAYLYTVPEVLIARPTDFASERARLGDLFYFNHFQSMKDYLTYVAAKDPTRVDYVSGAEWRDLFETVVEAATPRVIDIWSRKRTDAFVSYPRTEAPSSPLIYSLTPMIW